MQPPAISPSSFMILSALLDGRERPPREVARELQWHTSKCGFLAQTATLRGQGLIEKWSVVRSNGRVDVVLRITPAGVEAWQEFLDFATFFGVHYGPGRDAESGDADRPEESPIIARRPIEVSPPVRRRFPTKAESERLLRHASNAFRRIYRALEEIPAAGVTELARLEVDSVDLQTGAVTFGGGRGRVRQVRVSAAARQILEEAIGDRRSGPVFIASRGMPWTPANLSRIYRALRERAGLPPNVQLRARTDDSRVRKPRRKMRL